MKKRGYFGTFGGQFVSELLYPALKELEDVFQQTQHEREFHKEFTRLLQEFAGRPTSLYFAENTSAHIGCRVFLKREDLTCGGSHKITNALGQALLAKRMGKKRIVTETAAGMHGVATAMAARLLDMTCDVYMGVKDIARQSVNAEKIQLLGGNIVPVTRGHGVLKDAVSDALVAWICDLPHTHYLIGSAVGPHPFPAIVASFQSVIGKETRRQILQKTGKLPKAIIACGSGGSNAIGMFRAFLASPVELIFVEGAESAAFTNGSIGIFQGCKTFVLQDQYGMDRKTFSRAAGLNYPARGPELSHLFSQGRMSVETASNKEVLSLFTQFATLEGLLPAFETCHALAALFRRKGKFQKDDVVIVNFSGRGDKDMKARKAL